MEESLLNVGIAVQADWENREFISHISLNVRRFFEFLVHFEGTTKSKLASLNEKLDTLERRLELLEVQVGIGYCICEPTSFHYLIFSTYCHCIKLDILLQEKHSCNFSDI
ncbi:hypothetical protein ACOSQ3_021735 [Xanthoceras sorbifolium]